MKVYKVKNYFFLKSIIGWESNFSDTRRDEMFAQTTCICDFSFYRHDLDHAFALLTCYAVYVGSLFADVSDHLLRSKFNRKAALEDGTGRMSGHVGKSHKLPKHPV
jgi:hypothetical protein